MEKEVFTDAPEWAVSKISRLPDEVYKWPCFVRGGHYMATANTVVAYVPIREESFRLPYNDEGLFTIFEKRDFTPLEWVEFLSTIPQSRRLVQIPSPPPIYFGGLEDEGDLEDKEISLRLQGLL